MTFDSLDFCARYETERGADMAQSVAASDITNEILNINNNNNKDTNLTATTKTFKH